MPLIKSGTKKSVSENIRREMSAGKPQRQAIAIALSTARKYGKRDGGKIALDKVYPGEKYDDGPTANEKLRRGLISKENSRAAARDDSVYDPVEVMRARVLGPTVERHADGGKTDIDYPQGMAPGAVDMSAPKEPSPFEIAAARTRRSNQYKPRPEYGLESLIEDTLVPKDPLEYAAIGATAISRLHPIGWAAPLAKYTQRGLVGLGAAISNYWNHVGDNTEAQGSPVSRAPGKKDGGAAMSNPDQTINSALRLAKGGTGAAPWDVRRGSHPSHPAGMIKSSIPGRTDKIPMGVPPGSYILPADIPSAIGEGNTMAGEKILGNMFKIGPYGSGMTGKIGKSRANSGHFINSLRPPRPPRMSADGGEIEGTESLPAPEQEMQGMEQEQGEKDDVPIIAAGGEYVIHPETVAELGGGNLKSGHKILDKFVLKTRANHIKTLKGLAPPKK